MNSAICTGIAFFLLAGCATHAPNKPSAASAHPTPRGQQPLEEPKWEAAAGLSASDLLAQQTAQYRKTMLTPDTSAPAVAGFNQDTAKMDQRQKQTASDPSRQAAPEGVSLAQPASARLDPHGQNPVNYEPKIVPESADFQSTSPGAEPTDSLGRLLRKRVSENPRDIAGQLDLQLYGMLTDDPVQELATVFALPEDDREVLSALVDGLSNFRSTVRQDENMLTARKIKPLLEMADRLRAQALLTIPTAALCSRVDGYGKYTPIFPAHFVAGQANAAIVYCEVEHFLTRQVASAVSPASAPFGPEPLDLNSTEASWNPSQGPMWETRLTEQVTLYTDQGLTVWSDPDHDVTDRCRNRRHDFYAYDRIFLPATLSIGRYVLKVSIEDKNAGRVAEASVPLAIVAQK